MPTEIFTRIKTVYGESVANRTNVKEGRTNIHDEQRSRRPSILNYELVQNIEETIREDRRLTQNFHNLHGCSTQDNYRNARISKIVRKMSPTDRAT